MTHETHARIAALVAAGFLLTSGGAAFADTAGGGNSSTGGGGQAVTDTDAATDTCDDTEDVLGESDAPCEDEDEDEDEGEDEETELDHTPGSENQTPKRPGYDGEDLGEDPDEGETPEPGGEETKVPTDPKEEASEDDGEEPDDQEGPSVPGVPAEPDAPADESRVGGEDASTETSPGGLANTGMERGPLVALVAGGLAAVIAGVCLIVGLRRRAGA